MDGEVLGTGTRGRARTVLDRSNTEILGSNPVRGMDLCPRITLLCRALEMGRSPSKE
jgi:hypothetical protein